MQTVQNIIDAAVILGTFLLALLLAYVGFLYVTSPVNAVNRARARSLAISSIVGFLIVIGAFLIVSTIMSTFAREDPNGGWESFFGVQRSACEIVDVGVGGFDVTTLPSGPSSECPTCVSLSERGVPFKDGGEADEDIADRLRALTEDSTLASWWVTEAFEPTVVHSCGCHYNGTCVDVNFRGPLRIPPDTPIRFAPEGPAAELGPAIDAFVEAASREGLNAEYEVPTQEDRGTLIVAGTNPRNIKVIPGIVPHFSVYGPQGCQPR